MIARSLACGLAALLMSSCGAAQTPALGSGATGMASDARRTRGIYVANGGDILGYRGNNSGNRPPICMERGGYAALGIAADSDGNLIDADSASDAIVVFKGPGMCGQKLGSIHDPYGEPSDVASVHAATGTIAVAGPGSVAVCTLAGGCTKNLRIGSMYEVAGVALAANGNCWASSTNPSGSARLTYFKRCSGSGTIATGYRNAYYGGLDIEGQGRLLAISAFDSKLYVYKGCNPACSLAAGPYALHGEAVFGHLNEKSTKFAAGDFASGSVDVYAYAQTGLTYQNSFNNGLKASGIVEGVTYNRRAKE